MTVAFVFSGGASLGSIQVGMAQALERAGIKPDLILGTSVGAINGAWFAARKPADELADVWRSLRRQDLFPIRPLVGLRAFVGRRPNFVPNTGVRNVIDKHVPFKRLQDAPIPFAALATELLRGDEVILDSGPTVDAILASAALPGIFPTVTIDGQQLIDGGVVNNTPISVAIERGATEVWVLSTGYSCGLSRPPSSAIGLALHSIGLLVQQRLTHELESRHYEVPVHLIPPPCPVEVSPTDFSHSGELIDRARETTSQWLANGRPSAQPADMT